MKPCLAIKMQMVFGCVVLSLFSNLISVVWAQSDPAFNAQVDNPVYAMTVQPNGRIATGGQFTLLDGVPRNYLGRLNGDGSLDTAFNPGANASVYSSVVLTNGQILVGGSFTNLAGQPRSHLGRLNPDGTLDTPFNPGADGDVYSLLLQSDGKIVVAGSFTNLAGQLRNSIGRLNADGSPDGTFSASSSNAVYTLAMQPDGKILVGGAFLGFNGLATNYICRLNTNGVLDTNFVASPDNEVHSLAVQADGKILAGGLFYYMDGEIHNDLARLNPNGTVDSSFTASVRPGYLGDTDTIVVQSDGKILAGGTAIGWFGFPYFARFNSDGTVDTNFMANVPSGVHSIAIQRDGKIFQTNLVTDTGLFVFTDPQSSLFPNRFYRARIYDGILPAPAILTAGRNIGFTTNGFGFDLTGVAGQTLIIECSTNLSAWTALATNTLESELLYFTDWGATNSPCRFYRLRLN